jgi:iron-sulfur cluster assembly protein
MNITDRATELLQDVLQQHGAKGIRLSSINGCCGPQFSVSLEDPVDSDYIQMINGIQVAQNTSIETTEGLTIDTEKSAEGEGLVLIGASNCC